MKKYGFTLVEIMIVVAIIALLAAIAAPNLLRARINANESAAISALRTIHSSAIGFRSVNVAYPPDLVSLSSSTPAYIDAALGKGERQGYNFSLSGTAVSFSATARPTIYQVTGVRSFFIDESGVLHWTDNDAPATVNDLVLGSDSQGLVTAKLEGEGDAVPTISFLDYDSYVNLAKSKGFLTQNETIQRMEQIRAQLGPLQSQEEFIRRSTPPNGIMSQEEAVNTYNQRFVPGYWEIYNSMVAQIPSPPILTKEEYEAKNEQLRKELEGK